MINLGGTLAESRPPFVEFRRGFVDLIGQPLAWWVENFDRVRQVVPITSLRDGVGEEGVNAKTLQAFCENSQFSQIRQLEFPNTALGDALAEGLASARYLTNLRKLRLTVLEMTDEGFAAIVQAEQFAGLQSLYFHSNNLSDGGAETVVKRAFRGLQSLHLKGRFVGNGTPRKLAEGEFPRLRDLVLEGAEITNAGIRKLLDANWLPNLGRLWLEVPQLSDDALDALVKDKRFSGLRALHCGKCRISLASYQAVLQAKHLSQLQDLYFTGLPLGFHEMADLYRASHLSQLKRLEFVGGNIGDNAMWWLGECSHLSQLRILNLAGNKITDEGLVALLESKHFPRLRILDLRWNKISNKGAFALAAAKQFPNLRKVFLLDNDSITNAGRKALKKSPHLAKVDVFV